MKPVYLSIQAFGPFATKQTIEFEKLGTNPLFLINGPTGAGKSSVLDAMCFALYGDTTGKEREASSMRCDLSSDTTPTEIIFDFTLQDNLYRIIRTPSQEVAKKNGKGTTTKGPTAMVYKGSVKPKNNEPASLDLFEEEFELLPLKGVNEVNEWVPRTTGLTSEQFRQVMVLPQGQFRKLLLAESKDREDIFSKLFQTQIYKQIEDALKEQSAELRKNREALIEKLNGLLDSVNLSKMDELQAELEIITPLHKQLIEKHLASKTSQAKSQEQFQKANLINVDFKTRDTLKLELNQSNQQNDSIKQLSEIVGQAQNAYKIAPVLQQLKKIETQHKTEFEKQQSFDKIDKELNTQLKTQSKTLPEVEAQYQSLDAKKAELNEWLTKKEALKLWSSQTQSLVSINKQHLECESNITNLTGAIKTNQTQLEALSNEHKQNNEQLNQSAQIHADLNHYERLGKLKGEAEKHQQSLNTLQQQISDNQIQQGTIQTDLTNQQTQVLQLELTWHQGQAFELASQLKHKQACLVCGSTEHPNPAKQNSDVIVSKDDINAAREILSNIEKYLANNQSEHKLLLEKNQTAQNRLLELNEELGEFAQQNIAWFREQYAIIKAKQKQLEALQKTQAQNETQQTQLSQTIQTQKLELEQSNKQLSTIVIERTQCQTRINDLEQSIPNEFRDSQTLEREITRQTKAIALIEQQYKQLTDSINHTNTQLASNQSLQQDSQARIVILNSELAQAQTKWTTALNDTKFKTEQAFIEANIAENELVQHKQKIEQHQTKQAELTIQIKQLDSKLVDTALPDLALLQTNIEQASTQLLLDEKALRESNSRFDALNNADKKIKTHQVKMNEIDAQYKVIGTLSDVASGKSSKVSLQRYVLGVLLDDVLNEASQRLQLMSKGRYVLRRKLEKTKGNKSSGLDLEVEDAYSGARRPANTLSGGESFMAALSLALGLSDVVQNYSGGIKLDTLFIDEGFGSLDVESLDLAIQTLIDLRKSGRTIGIISHVSELKEQMSQRIDLTPSNTGSVITMCAS
ncbi:AAA family ATPase [Marinicellulosiphila megalodicopiae]|uniref:AAA family ATPase n=1 Tax=Marinicellulosiphila megalodicopiae TaxID=2724896 RepID=UPI003BAF4A13